MAPPRVTVDYYAVLEVDQTADEAAIRSNYRRLAKLQHPDKNPDDTQATARFQVLLAAYSTLSDPSARRIYDLQYASIKSNRANTTNTTRENNRDGPSSQSNDRSAGDDPAFNQLLRELQQSLRDLLNGLVSLKVQASAVIKDLEQTEAVLRKLQDEEQKEKDEDTRRNSWIGYFFTAKLSAEEREARELRAVTRRAAQRVRTAEAERLRAQVRSLEGRLREATKRIDEKRNEISMAWARETARQAAIRRAEEERNRAKMREQQRARKAEKERKEAEEAERIFREFRKAQEAADAQWAEEAERLQRQRRQAQEAERVQRERNARKAEEERAKNASRRKNNNKKKKQQSNVCLHKAWWTREPGRAVCQECDGVLPRFAFRCPGCQMVACASCRDDLRRRTS